MNMQDKITQKLTDSLAPVSLEVINESHEHQGHAGDNGTGESHFRVKVVSPQFAGCNRVECHRMIHEILKEELRESIHALTIQAASSQS